MSFRTICIPAALFGLTFILSSGAPPTFAGSRGEAQIPTTEIAQASGGATNTPTTHICSQAFA